MWKHLFEQDFLFVEATVRTGFPICGSNCYYRVSYLWKHLFEQGFLFLEATVRTGFPICGSTCLSSVSYLWKQLSGRVLLRMRSYLFLITHENRLAVTIIIISCIYHNIIGGFLGTLSGSPQFPICGSNCLNRVSYLWKQLFEQCFLFVEATVRTGFPICGSNC